MNQPTPYEPEDNTVKCVYPRGSFMLSAKVDVKSRSFEVGMFNREEGIIARPTYDPGPLFAGEVGYVEYLRKEQFAYYSRMHDELANDGERLATTRRFLAPFMLKPTDDAFDRIATPTLRYVLDILRGLKGSPTDSTAAMIAAAAIDDLQLDVQTAQMFSLGDRMLAHAESCHEDPELEQGIKLARNSIDHLLGKLSATTERMKKIVIACNAYFMQRHGQALPEIEMVRSDMMPVIMAARTKIFGDIVIRL